MLVITPNGADNSIFCERGRDGSLISPIARLHTIDTSHRARGQSYGLITGLGDTADIGDTTGWSRLLSAIVKEARKRQMSKLVAMLVSAGRYDVRDAYCDNGFNAHGYAYRLDLAPTAAIPSSIGNHQQRWPRRITRPDGTTIDVGAASLVVMNDGLEARPLALLEDLVIEPSWRGQGHARALVEEIIVRARDNGCRSFMACTRFKNTTAQKLYCSLGMDNVGLEFRVDL